MSDADCTPGREPRSIAASLSLIFHCTHAELCCATQLWDKVAVTLLWNNGGTLSVRWWLWFSSQYLRCCYLFLRSVLLLLQGFSVAPEAGRRANGSELCCSARSSCTHLFHRHVSLPPQDTVSLFVLQHFRDQRDWKLSVAYVGVLLGEVNNLTTMLPP